MKTRFKKVQEKAGRSVIYFDDVDKELCDGIITNQKGDAFTFYLDDVPHFTPSCYLMEYEADGARSGIAATKAKFWIIPIEASFYIFPREALSRAIMDNNWNKASVWGKGYFIIPVDWILNNEIAQVIK